MPNKVRGRPKRVAKNWRNVTLNGEPINLSDIARQLSMDKAHLSRIMSGKRTLSVPRAQAIANCLKMPVDEFITLYQTRIARISGTL